MALIADLGAGPVGVDTAVFIYLAEENPRFLPLVDPLFRAVAAGRRDIFTSAITLLEVLVVPYQEGNDTLAERYEAILTRSRGVHVVELTRAQLRAAARLRAATGVKTPDALQLAAALTSGCKVFVTNDRRLPAVSGLRVLQLSAYVARR